MRHNHDLIATPETCWDELYNWSAETDGYKLLKKDKQKRELGEFYSMPKMRLIAQRCF